MTSCCQCEGIEAQFGERAAARDLRRYHRRGPLPATRLLVEAIRDAGVRGATLLDVGGGVGAVQHELFAAGLSAATQVDAASHYLAASRAEAERRGTADRVRFLHGDFLDWAPELPEADVVTLDRVLCCYPDMEGLVAAAAGRARRLLGLVYPRERLATRALLPLGNLLLRMRGTPFRIYLHPTEAVDAAARRCGFLVRQRFTTPLWQVWLYARGTAARTA